MPNTIIPQNRAVRALPAQGPSGGPPVTKQSARMAYRLLSSAQR